MRIVIITSCTGQKVVNCENCLTLEDFRKGSKHLLKREKDLKEYLTSAENMYSGQQHVRLMRGVNVFRERTGKKAQVDLWVLSAGYGLIPGNRKIVPYECTFQGMKNLEIKKLADILNVPKDFRNIVNMEYDLALILLGDSYLQACDFDASIDLGGGALLFCGTTTAKILPKIDRLRIIALSNPEAKRFSCGLVALKGEIASRILAYIGNNKNSLNTLTQPSTDILSLLDKPSSNKLVKTSSKSIIPSSERARFIKYTPRENAKMLYFIPEWDDRVDPNYDFITDGITIDRDPYSHDVYAHEIYPKPNYDGILVSKSVIEENKRKKTRIEQIGIHAHVRVPRNFPVMGDCGAFNYIEEQIPPYTTSETLEFYQRLDFDYGVSVDHLILPQFLKQMVFAIIAANGKEKRITEQEFKKLKSQGHPIVKNRSAARNLFEDQPHLVTWEEEDLTEGKRRWEITLKNSADFIREHKKHGYSFVPIAGCQGWDVDSQVEMFRQQQKMGYKYIALGGLVRSKTHVILEVLEGISHIRRPDTRIHIFGVARPEAIQEFLQAGVNSIDSARFLRQAWLSATSNYYSGDTDRFIAMLHNHHSGNGTDDNEIDEKFRYAAVRIPPLEREGGEALTAKASELIKKGYTLEKLKEEESKSLNAIRAYDRGKMGLEETLEVIRAYDELMEGDSRNISHYRKVLEDKPWLTCPCKVCQETGIDVIIFRRNNRNRRRGFHNTWWFYKLFTKMTNGK